MKKNSGGVRTPRSAELTWGDYAERCVRLAAGFKAARDYRRWFYWLVSAELFADWPVDHLCQSMQIGDGDRAMTLNFMWAELERDEAELFETTRTRCHPIT